jgi:hypothetical protein
MKRIYVFILILFIPFAGCTSTYIQKDFLSKEDFYKKFNNAAAGKTVNIKLTDGSIITGNNAKILDDTLVYFIPAKRNVTVTKNDIKKINYYGSDMNHLSAVVVLKSGETVHVKNLKLYPDSSIITGVTRSEKKYIPVSELKNMSYNKHWLGVPIGVAGGIILSRPVVLGAESAAANHYNPRGLWAVPVVEIIGGGVIGWLVGFNYTYQFNP